MAQGEEPASTDRSSIAEDGGEDAQTQLSQTAGTSIHPPPVSADAAVLDYGIEVHHADMEMLLAKLGEVQELRRFQPAAGHD